MSIGHFEGVWGARAPQTLYSSVTLWGVMNGPNGTFADLPGELPARDPGCLRRRIRKVLIE